MNSNCASSTSIVLRRKLKKQLQLTFGYGHCVLHTLNALVYNFIYLLNKAAEGKQKIARIEANTNLLPTKTDKNKTCTTEHV